MFRYLGLAGVALALCIVLPAAGWAQEGSGDAPSEDEFVPTFDDEEDEFVPTFDDEEEDEPSEEESEDEGEDEFVPTFDDEGEDEFAPTFDDEGEDEFAPSFDDEGEDEFAPTFDDEGEDEFAPTFDDEGEDEFAPTFDDEGEDEFAPTFDDEGEDEFAPTFDDEGEDEFAPTFDDEDEFAPSFDDEDEDEFAPTFDDEGEDEFAPTFDDEDEFAPAYGDDDEDEFAPSFDDEDEDEFAPSFDDEDEDEFAPSFDDEDEFAPAYGDDDEDEFAPAYGDDDDEDSDEDEDDESDDDEIDEDSDEYWDQYWELFEEEQDVGEDMTPADEMIEGQGRVIGTVIDDEFEDPVGGIEITLDEVPDFLIETGPNGQFFIDLDPGFYIIRFENFAYRPSAYEIEIAPGETTDMAFIRMIPSSSQEMTIVVEGRQDAGSTSAQLREREESATVSDAISSEQFSQAPDSSASSVVRRVVGATIIDGRFLVIRGLSGRYTNGTINGVPIPRTDPNYPGVEFDLFPTDLLASVIVYKSFTTDLIANFTGGLMELQTLRYPEEFEFNASISFSSNSSSLLADRLNYEGGSLDWLGFDDGTRSLPDAVPEDSEVNVGSILDPDGLTPEEIEAVAEAFPNTWAYSRSLNRPNMGFGLSVGDTVDLGSRDFGYLFLLDYSNSAERELRTIRTIQTDGSTRERLRREDGEESTLWGAMGTATLQLTEGHDLTLVSLWNQSARDRTSLVTGQFDEEDAAGEVTTLSFVTRSFFFNQLVGSHRRLLPPASPWHETEINWTGTVSRAVRTEPDTRYLRRFDVGDGSLAWRPNPGSGERFYSELTQTDYNGRVALTLPYVDSFSLDLGGSAGFSERDFSSRRFRYTFRGDPELRQAEPEVIFADEKRHRERRIPGGHAADGHVRRDAALAGRVQSRRPALVAVAPRDRRRALRGLRPGDRGRLGGDADRRSPDGAAGRRHPWLRRSGVHG